MEKEMNNKEILNLLNDLGKCIEEILSNFGNMKKNNSSKVSPSMFNKGFLKSLHDFYIPTDSEGNVILNEKFNLGFPIYNYFTIYLEDTFKFQWSKNVLKFEKNFKNEFNLSIDEYTIAKKDGLFSIKSATDHINEEDVIQELQKTIAVFERSAAFYNQLLLIVNDDAKPEDISNFVTQYRKHSQLLTFTMLFAPIAMKILLIKEIQKENENYNMKDFSKDIFFIYDRIREKGFSEENIENYMRGLTVSFEPNQSIYQSFEKLFFDSKLQDVLESKSIEKTVRNKI